MLIGKTTKEAEELVSGIFFLFVLMKYFKDIFCFISFKISRFVLSTFKIYFHNKSSQNSSQSFLINFK